MRLIAAAGGGWRRACGERSRLAQHQGCRSQSSWDAVHHQGTGEPAPAQRAVAFGRADPCDLATARSGQDGVCRETRRTSCAASRACGHQTTPLATAYRNSPAPRASRRHAARLPPLTGCEPAQRRSPDLPSYLRSCGGWVLPRGAQRRSGRSGCWDARAALLDEEDRRRRSRSPLDRRGRVRRVGDGDVLHDDLRVAREELLLDFLGAASAGGGHRDRVGQLRREDLRADPPAPDPRDLRSAGPPAPASRPHSPRNGRRGAAVGRLWSLLAPPPHPVIAAATATAGNGRETLRGFPGVD